MNISHRSTQATLGILIMAVALAAVAVAQESQRPSKEGASMYFETGEVEVETADGEKSYEYRFMRPDAKAGDGPHPLVVFLHGAGERGSDNERQLTYLPRWMTREEHRNRHACYLLAVQCPENERWTRFVDEESWKVADIELTNAMQAVLYAIDELIAEYDIDETRIYLTGLSMGGYGSWVLAARQPDRFAAVVPICGGGVVTSADRLKGVPIWAFHGLEDKVVEEEESRLMIDAIREAGGLPRYTALEGVQHDSWTHAYNRSGAIEWMFSQQRSPKEKTEHSTSESE